MSNRSRLIRLGLAAGLVWLGWAGWRQVQGDDGMMLLYFLAVGAVAGLLVVKFLLPALGDALGNLVFSSGEKITSDENYKAVSLAAQGEYEAALAEYEKLLRLRPGNTQYVAEAARLCAERLGRPGRAVELLRQSLEGGGLLPDEDAFLRFRLAHVQELQLEDLAAARRTLEEIVGRHPQTRHSANARHKLSLLDQAEYKQRTGTTPPPEG